MNQNISNSSSPLSKLVPIIIVLGGVVALYYLYQYLFGVRTVRSSTLISSIEKADIDASKPIIIPSTALPPIYEGGEFTISTWIYINNWNYRAGFNKHILSIGGQTFDTIRIYIGGNRAQIHVRLQTKDKGVINHVNPDEKIADSLDRLTQNATFNILQTDSSLLDTSPLCDLPEIELQKWVNLTVSVNGKTIDVYLDGKLSRSCVLPSFYKVDAGGYSATILQYGGFGGVIANTMVYDTALNPEDVYKNYMAGPEPITNLLEWLKSFFTPSAML